MIRKTLSTLRTYRDTIAFLSLSIVSAGINYLYYPIIARMLSVEDFGSSQALITVLTQAGALFAGLSLLSIFLMKKYRGDKAKRIINLTQKIIIASLLVLTIVIACFHTQIAQLLNIQDGFNIIIVAISLAVSIPFVVTFGVMLAERRFLAAAYMQLLVVCSKIVLGLILIPFLGGTGAIVAIGVSYLLGMGIFWFASKLLNRTPWTHNILKSYIPPTFRELIDFKPFAFPVLCILMAATILVILPGLDILLARHYLDPTTAGIYSAASTISSIVLFASLPVINILIPLMDGTDISKSFPQLKKAFALLSVIVTVSLLMFYLIPAFLLSLLGDIYKQYSDVLIVFGINMVLICVLTIFVQILALYKPFLATFLSISTLILAVVFVMLNHDSGREIITSTATSYAIMVTILTIAVVFYIGRRKRVTWLVKK